MFCGEDVFHESFIPTPSVGAFAAAPGSAATVSQADVWEGAEDAVVSWMLPADYMERMFAGYEEYTDTLAEMQARTGVDGVQALADLVSGKETLAK